MEALEYREASCNRASLGSIARRSFHKWRVYILEVAVAGSVVHSRKTCKGVPACVAAVDRACSLHATYRPLAVLTTDGDWMTEWISTSSGNCRCPAWYHTSLLVHWAMKHGQGTKSHMSNAWQAICIAPVQVRCQIASRVKRPCWGRSCSHLRSYMHNSWAVLSTSLFAHRYSIRPNCCFCLPAEASICYVIDPSMQSS